MKRNKHFEKEQKVRHLQIELDELYEIQAQKKWVKLDKPIKKGKIVKVVLRDDIRRSKHGDMLQEWVENHYYDIHLKRDLYKKWVKAGMPDVFRYGRYRIKEIIYRKRNRTSNPKVEKYLWRNYLSLTIPRYFLKFSVENWIVTHQQIIDTEVESKIAYLEDKISQLNGYKYPTISTKDWKKKYSRVKRLKVKKAIHDFEKYGEYDDGNISEKKCIMWDIF